MRAAIFGDIHGNLPALEAVLADLRQHAPDVLICLGDVAMTGPWPNECLHLVASLNCPVVMGNADAALLVPWPAFQPRGLPDEREIYELDGWSHAAVGETERELVRTYQPDGGRLAGRAGLSRQPGEQHRGAECRDARGPAERAARRVRCGSPLDRRPHPPPAAAHARRLAAAQPRLGGPAVRTQKWRLRERGPRRVPAARPGSATTGASQFRQVAYPARAIQEGFRAARVPDAERWASDWVDA